MNKNEKNEIKVEIFNNQKVWIEINFSDCHKTKVVVSLLSPPPCVVVMKRKAKNLSNALSFFRVSVGGETGVAKSSRRSLLVDKAVRDVFPNWKWTSRKQSERQSDSCYRMHFWEKLLLGICYQISSHRCPNAIWFYSMRARTQKSEKFFAFFFRKVSHQILPFHMAVGVEYH